jgi:hypothetical protein
MHACINCGWEPQALADRLVAEQSVRLRNGHRQLAPLASFERVARAGA